MTEQDWLACTDPLPLLAFLQSRGRASRRAFRRKLGLSSTDPQAMLAFLRDSGKLTDRKARLFAVACCRHIGSLLTDRRSQQAIEVAEEYVDGAVGPETLDEAAATAEDVYQEINLDRTDADAAWLESAAYAAWLTCVSTWRSPVETHSYDWDDAREAASAVVDLLGGNPQQQASEPGYQAALIRCILASPFRSVAADPNWLTQPVLGLALAIYAERTFDLLPVLADALQEAGCDDADILGHLRGPGPHGRGCSPVDLVLGKT